MRNTARLLTFATFCAGAFAQTTPPAIQTLTLETTLPFSQIGITGDTDIPSNVLASVTGGALEIRQLVELWPAVGAGAPGTNTNLRIRHILVQPGAPNPTPTGTQNAVLEDYIVRIDDTIRTIDPNTVTYVGTIDTLNANSPLAGRTGRPAIYSLSWEGTPRRVRHTTLLIPGRLTTFAATSSGTLLLAGETPGGTPGPGTGTNQPPVARIAGGPRITTSQTEISLDASGSSDPGNSALTYSWRVVHGAANLINPTSATPRIQFGGNADEYVFEVTVRNAAGATSTATINVFYTGRF